LDEYGGTAGIVTMEDLVEELVGDITDEYDVVTEERISARGDMVIEGLTTLDDFAEKTGLVLPEGPYDTLAGFFMARLGQLPSVGDAISLELASTDSHDEELAQVELRVSELDGRRAAAFVVHRQDGEEFAAASP
jgi:putative hemolysin